MNVNRSTLLIGVAVVVIGLAIGAGLAMLTHGGTAGDRQQVAVVTQTRVQRPAAAPRARPTTLVAAATATAPPATPAPTATPVPTARPATPAPTPLPTRVPTTAPARVAVAVPAAPAAPANGASAVRGTWRLDETNVHVGSIVWIGQAVPSGSTTLALDVHKERVGGRAAVPCERQTQLHAALAAGGAQTVPYTEVNCSGSASSGELRVTAFSADGTSFTGSFWSDGAKLGDVRGTRL